jgi:hypothetical protein
MSEQTMHFIARPFVVPSNPCVFKLLRLCRPTGVSELLLLQSVVDHVLSK